MESKAKVQKDGGGQQVGGDVAPIHGLIERVQLARIVKAGRGEGSQAQQVEVQRFGRAGPAEIDEKADCQIGEPDGVLIVNSGIARGGLDKDVAFLKLDSIPPQRVPCLPQKRNLPERLRDIERFRNREALYLDEFIA